MFVAVRGRKSGENSGEGLRALDAANDFAPAGTLRAGEPGRESRGIAWHSAWLRADKWRLSCMLLNASEARYEAIPFALVHLVGHELQVVLDMQAANILTAQWNYVVDA